MTAIRASQSASPPGQESDDFSSRSAFGPYGIPLWGAILVAAVPTAIGTVVDVLIWEQPGILFKTCFFLGCLAAVLMVRRDSVFGPMVQPPLTLGIVMPLLVLLTGAGSGAGGGLAGKALAIARPLITSFPIMAGAAAVTLGIGLVRMLVTERAPRTSLDPEAIDPEAKTRKQRPVARKQPARGEDRKAAPPTDRKKPPENRRKGTPERREKPARGEPRGAPQSRGEAPRGGAQPRGSAQPRGEGRPKPPNQPGRSGGAAPRRDQPAGRPRPADQRKS
ncbi:DUF6542 domain-containing protein, partial [Saccharopolyspora griseoalba]